MADNDDVGDIFREESYVQKGKRILVLTPIEEGVGKKFYAVYGFCPADPAGNPIRGAETQRVAQIVDVDSVTLAFKCFDAIVEADAEVVRNLYKEYAEKKQLEELSRIAVPSDLSKADIQHIIAEGR